MSKQAKDIKDIWSRFTTGVSVMTTNEEIHGSFDSVGRATGEGSPGLLVHGMTANALCSVSVEPPLLLLSVGVSRKSKRLIENTNRFGVNFLNTLQIKIAAHFSTSDSVLDESEGLNYWYTAFGTPMIASSLAYIDCNVVNQFAVADHVIFIAEAEHFELGQGEPLVYYERGYTRLDDQDD